MDVIFLVNELSRSVVVNLEQANLSMHNFRQSLLHNFFIILLPTE